MRTPQEPKENEKNTAVVVQVRHVSLGIVRRYFREWEHMACAYDWVGSLCLIPEQFQLLDYAGKLLLPSQPVTEVKNTTLYMREALSTPSLEDDEVTFLGFGSYEWEPTADYSLQPISETPPETLLECDDSIMSELEDNSAQEQLRKGKKSGRKKTKDRGRLFRQQHLQSLLTEQKPTPSMPGDANYVSSQSQTSQSDRWPAVVVETDQDLTVEGVDDQGSNSGSATDQGSVSGHGSG